jgi:hypothetical protein
MAWALPGRTQAGALATKIKMAYNVSRSRFVQYRWTELPVGV